MSGSECICWNQGTNHKNIVRAPSIAWMMTGSTQGHEAVRVYHPRAVISIVSSNAFARLVFESSPRTEYLGYPSFPYLFISGDKFSLC